VGPLASLRIRPSFSASAASLALEPLAGQLQRPTVLGHGAHDLLRKMETPVIPWAGPPGRRGQTYQNKLAHFLPRQDRDDLSAVGPNLGAASDD
jgi:hypothetical protein